MLIETTSLLLIGVDAQALLNQSDFLVSRVDTVLEAAHYLSNYTPQLLLIDAMLIDALRRLEVTTIPMIALVSDEAQGEQTIWQGAQAYIAWEDLEPRILRYVIRHVLERLMLQNTLHMFAEQTFEHEMHFRNLIARNTDGMVVIDRSGMTRFVNPAAEALLGGAESVMIGKPFTLPLNVGESATYDIRRASGALVRVEMRVINIEWLGKPAYLASLHDISLRHRMEQRLQETVYENSLFATAINRLTIGVMITSLQGDHHHIAYVNPAFTAITGYTSEDVIGREPALLQGIATNPADVETMAKTLEEERLFEGVVLNYRKDGTPFWNKLSINPVFDEVGTLINWVGLVTDFTPIIEAEAQLKKERDFSSAIIDTAGSLIVVTDARGRVVSINPAFKEVTGYSLEEVDEAVIWELIFQGDSEYGVSELSAGKALEPMLGVHVGVMQTSDARQLKILWRSTALLNPAGQIEYLIITGLDITEREHAAEAQVEKEKLRVALEKERELNELKSRFVSMISHELRTPLATIVMASDLLKNYRQRFSEDEIDRRLNQIQAQVMHLTDLMDDMLMINRAETVGLDFHPAETNMEEFCSALVQEMLFSSERDYQIHFNYLGMCPQAQIDPRLMRQMMVNLLSNAMKYSTPPTRIDLELECVDQMMRIRVSDQGIGIPPEDLTRLFDTFARASNVGSIPGTGIGLVIVKYVVELHSGTVSVESQLNVGTTFTIVIPLTPP